MHGKVLNPVESHRVALPSWRRLVIHGRTFWLEASTLELREGEDEPAPSGTVVDPMPEKPPAIAPGPRLLVLIPTFGCNLACRYCFAQEESGAPKMMSFETARQAIAAFPRGTPINISYFGGEPLLAFDLIKQVHAYAVGLSMGSAFRNIPGRSNHPSFHVTTNATLIDDAKATWLAQSGFSAIVSIDGPQDIHDEHRVYADGRGSWTDALRGINRLAAAGCRAITLRGTFGPGNVRLVERVEFLNGLVRRGVGHTVSVEPSCLAEHECTRGVRGFKPSDIAGLAREYHALAGWMLAEWEAGRPPRHVQLERMIRRLLDRRLSGSQCGAGNGYWTCGPDGTLYACHRASDAVMIGQHNKLDKRRKAWLDNRLVNSQKCGECWARFLCGGICRQDGLVQSGDMWTPTGTHCAIRMEWIREAIWLISEGHRRGIIDRIRETADRSHGRGRKSCCGPTGEKGGS